MPKAYQFQFRPDIGLRDAEDTLLLAFLAAEAVFGETRVRMDARYRLDPEARLLAVDASSPVGQVVAAVFTAYIAKEFGRDSFRIRRLAVEVLA